MGEPKISDAQARRLYNAAFDVCGAFAADACRVIAEFDEDTNLVPYLKNLSVKYARELEWAVFAISDGAMETESKEAKQRQKYEAAMAELKASK